MLSMLLVRRNVRWGGGGILLLIGRALCRVVPRRRSLSVDGRWRVAGLVGIRCTARTRCSCDGRGRGIVGATSQLGTEESE